MELQEIRDALPKKGVKKIAEKIGKSHSTVSRVLKGDRENDAVIDAALEVIAEDRAIKANRAERLKNLLA